MTTSEIKMLAADLPAGNFGALKLTDVGTDIDVTTSGGDFPISKDRVIAAIAAIPASGGIREMVLRGVGTDTVAVDLTLEDPEDNGHEDPDPKPSEPIETQRKKNKALCVQIAEELLKRARAR